MAKKFHIKRRAKYHLDHIARRLRFHSLKAFSTHARQPTAKGSVICHIIDVGAPEGLVTQLRYLVERDVVTFRIYTDRKSYVEEVLDQEGVTTRYNACILQFRNGEQAASNAWKLIDSYNWSQSHDKWSLILNTGEYFLYPHFNTRTISDLCQFLADEHRRSIFSILLDAYRTELDATPLEYMASGWRIDRYGYEFRYSSAHDTDLWQGGFTCRFLDAFKSLGRKHITRVPLQKIGRKSMPTRDLLLALPPKANAASAPDHLSPTGCILSSRCFEHWRANSIAMGGRPDFAKLTSAPALPIKWSPTELIENGFMNEGQWL